MLIPEMEERHLRYRVYTELIQGARGLVFFNYGRAVSSSLRDTCEAMLAEIKEKLAPYLMQDDPSASDPSFDARIDREDFAFLVRKHPTHNDTYLFMVAYDNPDVGFYDFFDENLPAPLPTPPEGENYTELPPHPT